MHVDAFSKGGPISIYGLTKKIDPTRSMQYITKMNIRVLCDPSVGHQEIK